MEYYYQQDKQPVQNETTSSGSLAVASLILGITAFISACCIIAPIPIGAISIILGILSKGNDKKMPVNSKIGIAFSIAGLFLAIAITIYAIVWFVQNPDSEFMRQLMESYYEGYESTY
ncbi:hypothetical protein [Anaerobium acetethylicum]|uniref:DUF4190 domain-containing protein n=1 Tax=Anaerobium acetethylicum TaxID=1619234 RepID=A0A1D3TXE3_9FIRM|nr:hypothetical protein [Anaerobium acetethylicum]SCP99001.1 hypothetical protein SAMN05421730_103030 [Anaerobium acetethylicum]